MIGEANSDVVEGSDTVPTRREVSGGSRS